MKSVNQIKQEDNQLDKQNSLTSLLTDERLKVIANLIIERLLEIERTKTKRLPETITYGT